MDSSSDFEQRLRSLEQRLEATEAIARDAEDRWQVQNLVAECAYLIDAEAYDKRAELFAEGGVFELIPQETFPTVPDWEPTTAQDVIAIPAGDEDDAHLERMRAANKRGLSHFPSQVHVTIDGDNAVAAQHIAVFERDPTADPLEVPPHGIVRGFRPLLVAANYFECERTPGGWRINRRSMRVNTGAEARKLLGGWAARADVGV